MGEIGGGAPVAVKSVALVDFMGNGGSMVKRKIASL